METAANRLSLYFEAHCFFRQFVDVLCCRLVYWSKKIYVYFAVPTLCAAI